MNYTKYLLLTCLILLPLIVGCAGYRIGNETLYRRDIRTVYVPIFESDSFRRNLAERLTEAVVKRIEARTSYKVVNRPSADSTLHGRIRSESQRVTARNDYGDARQKMNMFVVEIQWTDRRSGTQIQHFELSMGAQFVPEFGNSQSTAQQAAIDRLAAQIVERMESVW